VVCLMFGRRPALVGHNTMGYIHIRSMSTYTYTYIHTHTEATTIAITFSDNITMLAACIAEGTKQRPAVCPSVCLSHFF